MEELQDTLLKVMILTPQMPEGVLTCFSVVTSISLNVPALSCSRMQPTLLFVNLVFVAQTFWLVALQLVKIQFIFTK